jgi:hypothetical protein
MRDPNGLLRGLDIGYRVVKSEYRIMLVKRGDGEALAVVK